MSQKKKLKRDLETELTGLCKLILENERVKVERNAGRMDFEVSVRSPNVGYLYTDLKNFGRS